MAERPSSNGLMASGPRDPLVALFSAWRLWLLGALVGALLGWLTFQLFPPDYRARATVVVDMNVEEAWQYFPDRELFQLIGRETERLELLAWSDAVLAEVAAQTETLEAGELRGQVLQLSQPADGGWRLYADHGDPGLAEDLASTWAEAFVAAARAAVSLDADLEAARNQLAELAAQNVDVEDACVVELMQELHFLAEHTQGISFYTQLHLSEAAGLPLQRTPSLATHLLVGSFIGALALALFSLIRKTA